MTSSGAHVFCVGTGNIGSHAAVLLARDCRVKDLTLVDPDTVEESNLVTQNFTRPDVGRFKVEVLAERIQSANPAVQVHPIAEAVERVPLGLLWDADVIVGGLDGLSSRCYLGRAARRLGIPFLDGGVRAAGGLARIDVVLPSPGAACLECGISAEERAARDTRYPCARPGRGAPSSAPAYLGAITGAWLCHEVLKLDRGESRCSGSGYQVLIELEAGRCHVSTRRRAPGCPADHDGWAIQSLDRAPGALTLVQALQLVPASGAQLRVQEDAFAHRLMCPGCHAERATLFLAARLNAAACRCERCGSPMVPPGFFITDTLTLDQLRAASRRLSLEAVGLRPHDVFSIETASGVTHFELGG